MQQHQLETVNDLIGEQVLHLLGRPPGLFGVQVRPLWNNYYRVNVFVGADATSVRVAHSYFLGADGDGKITAPAPTITRQY
jgi:hypothetical protein